MEKEQLIIILAVAIVVLVGLGFWVYQRAKMAKPVAPTQQGHLVSFSPLTLATPTVSSPKQISASDLSPVLRGLLDPAGKSKDLSIQEVAYTTRNGARKGYTIGFSSDDSPETLREAFVSYVKEHNGRVLSSAYNGAHASINAETLHFAIRISIEKLANQGSRVSVYVLEKS